MSGEESADPAAVSDAALREAILDCFVRYAPGTGEKGRQLEGIAVDADWVALTLAGLPVETRIDLLEPEVRLRVKECVVEVRRVGSDMVDAGLLRRFTDVGFMYKGREQKINPYPPGLFMLSFKGAIEVLRRKTKEKKPC